MTYSSLRIGWYGVSGPKGSYARVSLSNSKVKTVLSSIVDMYCKYPLPGLKFLTPVLPKDNYKLTVVAMGEQGTLSDKKNTNYGSFIFLNKVIVNQKSNDSLS